MAATTATRELTVEQARAALSAMVSALPEDDPMRAARDDLLRSSVTPAGDGSISIGRWWVNTSAKRFSLVLANPTLLLNYVGHFTLDDENVSWRATIDELWRGHGAPVGQ